MLCWLPVAGALTASGQNGGNFEDNYQALSQAGKKFFLAQPPHVDVNLTQIEQGTFLKDERNDTKYYMATYQGEMVIIPDFKVNNFLAYRK